jgi:hypothetical protein
LGGKGDLVLSVQNFNDPDDIFNMNETVFFFRAQPTITLAKGTTSRGKADKERITICLTCNDSGNEKPRLINTARRPRGYTKVFNPNDT